MPSTDLPNRSRTGFLSTRISFGEVASTRLWFFTLLPPFRRLSRRLAAKLRVDEENALPPIQALPGISSNKGFQQRDRALLFRPAPGAKPEDIVRAGSPSFPARSRRTPSGSKAAIPLALA